MTWTSELAQRRVKIAHRLDLMATQAQRRGKFERADKQAKLAAKQLRIAYGLEMAHRSTNEAAA